MAILFVCCWLVACDDAPQAGGTGSAGDAPESGSVAAPASTTTPRAVTPAASVPGGIRNVVLLSLDTLRADRLGVYGHRRGTSPNIDAIASRSVVFDEVRTQAPQTAPSHASLFTSEYPGVHRIINVHGAHPEMFTLPAGLRTLAEVLDEAGFDTGAFVSGGNLTKGMGMDRGFDIWDEAYEDVSARFDKAISWIFAPGRRPFFAFVHTYQVHAPYLPPVDLVREFSDPTYVGPLRARTDAFLAMPQKEAWAKATGAEYWDGMLEYTPEDIRFLSDLYDGEVRYLDAEVRRFFEYLSRSDLLKSTAVILMSDHGEEFHDHGKYQHDQVFDELLHVPLIMRMPIPWERAGLVGHIATPVESIDVAPTILDMVGLDPASLGEVQGRSLLPLMRDPSGQAARFTEPVFSELVVEPGPKYHWAVVWQGWKYVFIWQSNIDHTWELLFRLSEDPGERQNLIESKEPEVLKALGLLKERLKSHRIQSSARAARIGPGGAGKVDEDMRRQLEALGYVGGGVLVPEADGAAGQAPGSGLDADPSTAPAEAGQGTSAAGSAEHAPSEASGSGPPAVESKSSGEADAGATSGQQAPSAAPVKDTSARVADPPLSPGADRRATRVAARSAADGWRLAASLSSAPPDTRGSSRVASRVAALHGTQVWGRAESRLDATPALHGRLHAAASSADSRITPSTVRGAGVRAR